MNSRCPRDLWPRENDSLIERSSSVTRERSQRSVHLKVRPAKIALTNYANREWPYNTKGSVVIAITACGVRGVEYGDLIGDLAML